ncbi:PRC-barrel domain-containing protein [Paracoccus fistulariae]|uniref:PRC-barrel domain-containing protein n=1 Tax=Paracoccus fistulariae TaxID=658446 RepID=A0ABY7SGD8_9RHOB|nr:PRC-barrel domain-containing protein [Paracoccus fistulariae]MDB6181737.1 PRC-barrel domain-containing protein [Paracoccus fistulariae]WCR05965.1 PRC-barrel domain-containing protein [Paracoccus fistulariae]
MKNLYLSTAVILSVAGAAFAQTATSETADDATMTPAADAAASDPADAMQTGLMRASALDGVDIFTTDSTGGMMWDDAVTYSEIDENWEKIGEVEDLVLDANGQIVGAIAEIGGFLGLGEKEVMLTPEETAIIVTEDRIAVVSALSKEALEQREEVAEGMRGDD